MKEQEVDLYREDAFDAAHRVFFELTELLQQRRDREYAEQERGGLDAAQ